MDNLGKSIMNLVGTSTGLDEMMQSLKRKCDTLCSRGDDINTQLEWAESSSTKKRRKEVENWLGNVERTRSKVQTLELQVSESRSLGRMLISKRLANHVEDLTKEVAELMEQGQFSQGLTLDVHDEVALLTPKLVGQSFERNLKIMWEYLRKAEVLKIGVWGMGGVGKTTLIKHIHNQILEHSDTFGHVYWITVSQNSSIRKLQNDIAKAINFDISFEDDESKRAARLSRELMRRTRSLLILDDVWNDICLDRVGITTAVNGCKLLITTRSLDVCRRLCCQEKIKIEFLSEEEAWYLFEKTLGHPKMVLSTEVLEVAKCVAQECAGLPLGIITLASCMREVNDIREWRNVLQALKESEDMLMGEKVFKVLEFSYNRLNDPRVQKCFLHCALYPEDYRIEKQDLIQNLIDGGVIGKMRNQQAQFDRGHAILNQLVNCCLLEDVECGWVGGPGGVKMHDLVRDMAIKIAGPQFMVKARMQLEEIPEEQEWSKDVERVSLIGNKLEEITSSTSPRCPKLLTLFLSDNYFLKRIENSFFEHMHALQVLNLSFCGKIEELPNSVSNLTSLSALVLSACSMLQHMPSLAQLTSLKRLDLRNSDIREVPRGLEMLVNLTYLDLSSTKLEVFPFGILPKLSQLEYLKVDIRRVKIKGEELRGLERLSTFEGRLKFDDKVNDFKEYIMSRRHYIGTNCSYDFYLDSGGKHVRKEYYNQHKSNQVTSKYLSISNITEEDANAEILEALLKHVESLDIENYKVARNLRDVWWLGNAALDRKECAGSFSKPSSSSTLFFQTLKRLSLRSLQNLHILFELEEERGLILPPSLPVFSCLKAFIISSCYKIKKLFEPGFLPYLPNLEEIHVLGCFSLEEIISAKTEEKEGSSSNYHYYSNVEYTLPKLKTLELSCLPNLKSICEGTMTCDALEVLRVTDCLKLQRIPLSKPPSSLRSIIVRGENSKEWWESVEWDDLGTKNLFQSYLKFNWFGTLDDN